MIKLIAIDVDGTLLDPEHKIRSEVKEAIAAAKQAGVKVVISTGRPFMGVTPILAELNLQEAGDFVITYNGALVQRADTGEAFLEETLAREDILEIDSEARKANLHCHFIDRESIYTTNRDIGKYTVHEAEMVHMPLYYRTASEISKMEIAKAMMVDDEEILDEGIAYLPFEFFEKYTMIKSSPYYLEIMNKKASKGSAVKHLAEKLYLEKDEVMAIGDQENDRSMLEVSGFPVAMGNGIGDLKKIAREITLPNTEAGVAHAINEWVLKEYENAIISGS